MSQSAVRTRRKRPSLAARRTGYVVTIVVNLAMLYAVNRWPGWDVLPFLSSDTAEVVGWVNASIVVFTVANLVYLVRDPVWLRSLGDALTTAFGIVVLLRIWQVFPLTEETASSAWGTVARVLLAVAIVGSAIGVVTTSVAFVRAFPGRERPASG